MPKRKAEKAEDPKPKPSKIKRAGTMATTVKEGQELLKQEAPELAKVQMSEQVGIETRSKQQVRQTLDVLMSEGSKGSKNMSESKAKAQFNMVFRLIDKDKDGFLIADELAEALRSLGKRPLKSKISHIIKAAAKVKTGCISSNEFVDYMTSKMLKKEKAKGKEKDEAKEKEEKGKSSSPEKKSKSKPGKRKGKGKGKGKEKVVTPEKEKAVTPEKEKAEPAAKPRLEKGRSITEFYTEYAGMHDEIVPEVVDKFKNPEGAEFDLGQNRAFDKFVILVGSFCNQFRKDAFDANPRPALENKGFKIIYTTSEKEFVENLENCDVAWVISNVAPSVLGSPLTTACKKFHDEGGGLFIWADNAPAVFHANMILKELLDCELEGSTPGGRVLEVGDSRVTGQFGRHLITSGITKLHEGVTISYPKENRSKILEVLATSSNNHPAIMFAENGEGKLAANRGRIVVDCGFTKLYVHWDTAGTARYVVNATVWLLGLDHKIALGAPLCRADLLQKKE